MKKGRKPNLAGMLLYVAIEKYGKEIVEKYKKGEKLTKLAEYYNTVPSSIQRIIKFTAGVQSLKELRKPKRKYRSYEERQKEIQQVYKQVRLKKKSGKLCRRCRKRDTGANYFYCDYCWNEIKKRNGAWWDGTAVAEGW